MARRYGKKKKKVSAGKWVMTWLLGLASALMLLGLLWLVRESQDDVVLDEVTNCPTTGPTSATVVLFDATDQISETTLADLKNEFRKVVGTVGPGGYLRVVRLTGTPGEIPLMFDGCNPGDGSTVDSWTNSPEMRQKAWEEKFEEPLDKLPDTILAGTGADQSPIMAAIQKIKLTVFDARIGTGVPHHLYVASDMIEHTDLYSQYKSGPDYGAYAKSEAAKDYRTHLEGVDVSILYVERPNRKFDAVDHAEFWREWIERQDGTFVKLTRLAGMNR
jgi:hypothetical protein